MSRVSNVGLRILYFSFFIFHFSFSNLRPPKKLAEWKMENGKWKMKNGRGAAAAALSLFFSLAVPLRAADAPSVDIPPTLDPAVAKGLAFLAKQQNPDG